MPPTLLVDITGIELDKVLFGPDVISQINPHRGHMVHLDAVVHVDPVTHEVVGYKDVREDEFWVPGHIPGRPLLPGVLMVEAAAQLASFYTKKYVGWEGFIGFGAVDNCKFRQAVIPPQRLYLLGRMIWLRHRRVCCAVQAMANGTVVMECEIVGVQMG